MARNTNGKDVNWTKLDAADIKRMGIDKLVAQYASLQAELKAVLAHCLAPSVPEGKIAVVSVKHVNTDLTGLSWAPVDPPKAKAPVSGKPATKPVYAMWKGKVPGQVAPLFDSNRKRKA